MAVNKNFVFRENWVGSKVAGMKTTFFAIFDPTWTHILTLYLKGSNKEFLNLKQYFSQQRLGYSRENLNRGRGDWGLRTWNLQGGVLTRVY